MTEVSRMLLCVILVSFFPDTFLGVRLKKKKRARVGLQGGECTPDLGMQITMAELEACTGPVLQLCKEECRSFCGGATIDQCQGDKYLALLCQPQCEAFGVKPPEVLVTADSGRSASPTSDAPVITNSPRSASAKPKPLALGDLATSQSASSVALVPISDAKPDLDGTWYYPSKGTLEQFEIEDGGGKTTVKIAGIQGDLETRDAGWRKAEASGLEFLMLYDDDNQGTAIIKTRQNGEGPWGKEVRAKRLKDHPDAKSPKAHRGKEDVANARILALENATQKRQSSLKDIEVGSLVAPPAVSVIESADCIRINGDVDYLMQHTSKEAANLINAMRAVYNEFYTWRDVMLRTQTWISKLEKSPNPAAKEDINVCKGISTWILDNCPKFCKLSGSRAPGYLEGCEPLAQQSSGEPTEK